MQTTTTNQLNTRVGQVGTNNDIKSTTDIAAIPNPLLGLAAGLANTLNLLTSTYGVDAASPLTFSGKDAIGFSTDGNFGAYMPGELKVECPWCRRFPVWCWGSDSGLELQQQ